MAVAPGVDLQDLQPEARNAVFAAMADLDKQGIPYTVTSGVRTRDQQAALYAAYQARGYTGLPAAPPGSSKHEVGDAVDVSVDPGHRQAVNDILSRHGLQWFGPGDHVHYTYAGPSARAATDLSFLNTGPVPAHDLSFLNTGGAAPMPKAQVAPDLSFLATPKPAPAPKSVDLSFLSTPKAAAPAPGTDLSFLNVPQAPAAPLFGGKAGAAAPGALSLPRGAAPLPGAVAPAGAGLQTKQDVQAQENLGLPQKALNIVNTPVSVASAFGNQLAREIGKTHAAGGVQQGRVDAGNIFPELVSAIRSTPWAKTFVQGIKGESSQFPELLRSFGEGAPNSAVGRFTQQHPAVTTGLDFALSFPLLAATDSLQNEVVGLAGRGLSALNRATGAGDKVISSIPGLQAMLQNGQTENALREVMGKNIAGFDRYYRDAAQAAEDARQTSQKYLHSGAPIAQRSPVTGQRVNKLEELVADYMDAGNPGSKYEAETPAPHQVAADSATAEQMHGILTRAKGVMASVDTGLANANALLERLIQSGRQARAAVDAGTADANAVLENVLNGARTAGKAVVDSHTEGPWSQAARDLLAEADAPLPRIPGETPLTSARAVKAKLDAIMERARAALPDIVQEGRAGAVSDYTAQKAGQTAASADLAAANAPRAAAVKAARARGPQVIRANAYNDLGTAAQDALRTQQRAREIGQIAQDAAAHGIDMADVQRIGDQYSRIYDNLGQHLVDMGLMKPEAYANLKGQYLPRLYLMTKGQPGDIDAFLKFLDSEGALTPEAVAEAQKRGLAKTWQAGVGAKQFTQSRELADFGARNDPALARALVPEATPAALHGIEAQTRAAGIASGMRDIAQNPEWAKPAAGLTLAERRQGWVDFPGKGPLSGMAVHPAVMRVLEEAKQPNVNRAVMHALLGPKLGEHIYQGNQVVRKAMLAGPSTIANVGVGHYWFAAAEAAQQGTHFTPLDYALAARDMRAAAKGGRVDPYLHEAMNQTDLLSRGAGILPKEAKRISGGVGLESRLQNVGRAIKGAGAKYLGATHDILAAGKFGLYRQLRKAGKSVDEAARLTRQATINYQGLPRAIRALDNGMIAPFITFTYRAAPLAGRMAARSPGLFSLATGNRLNWYLDRMADRLDQARGLPGGAVALRQAGGVGPTTFVLPGRHNAQGQQQYAQAPLAAPLLHHFGGGTSITEPIFRQIRGLAPVLSTAWQLALGYDMRGDTPRPIVPEGLPPGSDAEAAGERVKWIMHALVPPIAGLDRIKNAAQGTTAYAQSGLKPQTTGEAALQFLTGTRLGTAPALLPSRQTPPALSGAFTQARSDAALAEEKRSGGAAAGQAAMDRLSALFDRGSKDPDFVPNRGLADYAKGLSNPALRDALAAAKDRLPNVAFGEHYTGSDKVAETNRQIDWTYTLLHEADNPARNLHVKIREELFPFNRTLGAVQSP